MDSLGDYLWKLDWQELFEPKHSLLEMVLRGSLIYLAVFVLLRIDLRRQVGSLGTTDILVIVLIAEVAGNVISTDSKSIVEAVVLIATVLFWSFMLEWMQYHYPWLERLLQDRKLKLIENGKMLHRNMRSEFITREELHSQLRANGVEDAAEVKAAYLEANGEITVVKKKR
jgi:uncharacterized membrane protein YcaP (DUF421 family)